MACSHLEENWYINKANIHMNVIYLFIHSFIHPSIHSSHVCSNPSQQIYFRQLTIKTDYKHRPSDDTNI